MARKGFFNFLKSLLSIFSGRETVKLGIYGATNAGKTSIANRICKDWLGEEMGKVSKIPHETREIQQKEKVTMKSNGREINFNLIDTPGIATRIDYEDFVKAGLNRKEAQTRAKEATKGVIEEIIWILF
jgi:GTPase